MTITIAAITIGIAVDNTIHYIYRFKEKKNSQEMKMLSLINKTHQNVGFAVLTTSLTISLGFSVLILSNFIPTILFWNFYIFSYDCSNVRSSNYFTFIIN